LKKETIERALPDDSIKTIEDGLAVYRQWSTQEDIEKYGFLGIQIFVVK